MELYHYIGIVAVLGISYFAIKGRLNYNKNTKSIKNIVWKYSPYKYPTDSREHIIFMLLNLERKKRGLKAFKSDAKITSKAWDRTHEMDASGIIDHASAHDELIELKIDGSDGSADLIASNYGTAVGVVGRLPYTDVNGKKHKGSGWIGSVKHKKAIINPRYDYCGIHSLTRSDGVRTIDVLMLVDEKTVN